MTADGPDPRRFRLLDAMVLTIALAVAFGLIRLADELGCSSIDPGPLGRSIVYNHAIVLIAGMTLLPLSVAVLGLGLWESGGRRREVLSRPGMAACALAPLGATVTIPGVLIHVLEGSEWLEVGRATIYGNAFSELASEAYPMIVGAWAALWLVGRFGPARDWYERAGRAIGLGWIALFVPTHGYFLVMRYFR